MGQPHRFARSLPRRRRLDALVKDHGDIRSEGDLDIDRVLGREEVFAAIEVGAELHAFGRNFAKGAETEDLKAARVGQHGSVPAHESMDATHAPDELVAGPEVQMVSVGEDDLRALAVGADLFEDALRDGLHGGGGSDWHEDWRFDDTMRQGKLSAPTAALSRSLDFEL